MSTRLSDNLNSNYIGAATKLRAQGARRRIVAYVESFDDIFFWRNVLGRFEDKNIYFEVMLPSHTSLAKGKKVAITNTLTFSTLLLMPLRISNVTPPHSIMFA